jgi:hypothetical protein
MGHKGLHNELDENDEIESSMEVVRFQPVILKDRVFYKFLIGNPGTVGGMLLYRQYLSVELECSIHWNASLNLKNETMMGAEGVAQW